MSGRGRGRGRGPDGDDIFTLRRSITPAPITARGRGRAGVGRSISVPVPPTVRTPTPTPIMAAGSGPTTNASIRTRTVGILVQFPDGGHRTFRIPGVPENTHPSLLLQRVNLPAGSVILRWGYIPQAVMPPPAPVPNFGGGGGIVGGIRPFSSNISQVQVPQQQQPQFGVMNPPPPPIPSGSQAMMNNMMMMSQNWPTMGTGVRDLGPGTISYPDQVPRAQLSFNRANLHTPMPMMMMTSTQVPNQVPGGPFSFASRTNLQTPMPTMMTSAQNNMIQKVADQAYLAKIQELCKYKDFLHRKLNESGQNPKNVNKVRMLLEVLSDPNTPRISMELLLKCEAGLKKMESEVQGLGGSMFEPVPVPTSSVPAPIPAPRPQPPDAFELLQEAVLSSLKSDTNTASQLFVKTFRPTVEALTGHPLSDVPDPCECDVEPVCELGMDDIPGVLRREIRLLPSRFKVEVMKNAGRLEIQVSLNEPRLPFVPPLKIFIPPGYPDESPTVTNLPTEYQGSTQGFLSSMAKTLKSHIRSLRPGFTVMQLLQYWEMSIRINSNPKNKTGAGIDIEKTKEALAAPDGLKLAFLCPFPQKTSVNA